MEDEESVSETEDAAYNQDDDDDDDDDDGNVDVGDDNEEAGDEEGIAWDAGFDRETEERYATCWPLLASFRLVRSYVHTAGMLIARVFAFDDVCY